MFRAALAALAVILWCFGLYTAQQAERHTRSISARWHTAGVSPAQISRQEGYFREDGMQDIPYTTIWRERPSQRFSGERDNEANGTVIELFGYMEDVCLGNMIAGSFPAKGDVNGCVISEAAAFAIWGNINVLGMPVYWDGQQYYVYGVFRDGGNIMMVQTSGDNIDSFPNMQLRFHDGGSREDAARYLERAGFRGAQFLDTPLLGWLLGLICSVPALLLGFSVIIRLILRITSLRGFPRLLAAYLPFAVVGIGACVFLFGNIESVPSHLIPNKLSDFGFYGSLVDSNLEEIRNWLSFPSWRDLTFFGYSMLTLFAAFGSAAVFAVCISKIKTRTLTSCFVGCCASMMLMLIMAMAFDGGGSISINMSMWLMPCMWILTDYGLYLHETYLRPNSVEKQLMGGDVNGC